MSNQNGMTKRLAKLGLTLMLGANMSVCAGILGFGGDSWREEVLLHGGDKIIVERAVKRGGRHEIGQKPPIKEQSLAFALPTTKERVTWKTEFSEDVGFADFKPILLSIIQGKVFIVTTPMGCLSYNKWGRPNPPYVVFKYEGKEWRRIPLDELPTIIKDPNLIISSPDEAAKEIGNPVISAEDIKRLNSELTQPEYHTILREAYPGAAGGCEVLIRYKGYWIMPNDPVARSMVDRKAK